MFPPPPPSVRHLSVVLFLSLSLSFGSCCAHKLHIQLHREGSMWLRYYKTGSAAIIKISCFPCSATQGGMDELKGELAKARRWEMKAKGSRAWFFLRSHIKKKRVLPLNGSILHCKRYVFEEWEMPHSASTDSIRAESDWDIIFF